MIILRHKFNNFALDCVWFCQRQSHTLIFHMQLSVVAVCYKENLCRSKSHVFCRCVALGLRTFLFAQKTLFERK